MDSKHDSECQGECLQLGGYSFAIAGYEEWLLSLSRAAWEYTEPDAEYPDSLEAASLLLLALLEPRAALVNPAFRFLPAMVPHRLSTALREHGEWHLSSTRHMLENLCEALVESTLEGSLENAGLETRARMPSLAALRNLVQDYTPKALRARREVHADLS